MTAPVTYGSTVRVLRTPYLVVTETWHEPNTALARHDHENATINVVLSGHFLETIGVGKFACGSGSAVLKPAGAHHTNHYETGARCVVVEFGGSFLDSFPEAARLLRDRAYSAGGTADVINALQRELARPDRAAPLVLEGLSLQILGELTRARSASSTELATVPRWAARTREYLDAHCTRDLTIAQLATDAGVHPCHLNRCFKRYFGASVGTYVRRRRIALARQLLQRGDESLSEIAARLGFCDQSHFAKMFKKTIGLSPGMYRRLHGKR